MAAAITNSLTNDILSDGLGETFDKHMDKLAWEIALDRARKELKDNA